MNRFFGAIRGFVTVALLMFAFTFLTLLLTGNVRATLWVNGHHHPSLDLFFSRITLLGDWVIYLISIAVGWRISHKNALAAITALALSGLCVSLLKHRVFPERSRPSVMLEPGSIRQVPSVPLHRNNSFPSGHTATAFTGFCCMAFFTRSFGIQAIFALLAGLVAYSRMYLGQHFLVDLLAGAAIGISTALVSQWIFELWRPRWLHQERSLSPDALNNQKDDTTT
ncbi:MAG: phosphatase PAP2 family protein, partial [Bacteroidetes bacterium]|nr:phosphatase PAP2 family protein [Bacteroidota bacterium]